MRKLINEYDNGLPSETALTMTNASVDAVNESQEEINTYQSIIGEERFRALYPFEQYPAMGIKAALSTDNPCGIGILDLFGYLQVLVNGMDHSKPINEQSINRRNTFISLKEGIDMFTINGAWMANLENERGSIEVGKYADFLFTDKDPFKVNNNDVWTVSILNTFFEGKSVYTKAN